MRSRLVLLTLLLAEFQLTVTTGSALAFGRPPPKLQEQQGPEFPSVVKVTRDKRGECDAFWFAPRQRVWGRFESLAEGFPVSAQSGSVEARYCDRMFPPTLAAAFAGGYDVPAERLHITREELDRDGLSSGGNPESEIPAPTESVHLNARGRVRYQPIRSYQSLLASAADWDAVMELNRQAAAAWQMLVSCNQDDSEKARAAFARGRDLCGKGRDNEAASNRAMEILSSLHGSVRSFLESSLLEDAKGGTLLRKVHPLLTQLVLGNYASDQIELISAKDVHFVVVFQALVMHVSEKKDPYGRDLRDRFDKVSGEWLSQARRMLNSILFLQLVPATRCESWGLWPGMTRVALNYSFFLDTLRETVDTIQTKVDYACGAPGVHSLSGYSRYTPWDVPVLEGFKELNDFYSGVR